MNHVARTALLALTAILLVTAGVLYWTMPASAPAPPPSVTPAPAAPAASNAATSIPSSTAIGIHQDGLDLTLHGLAVPAEDASSEPPLLALTVAADAIGIARPGQSGSELRSRLLGYGYARERRLPAGPDAATDRDPAAWRELPPSTPQANGELLDVHHDQGRLIETWLVEGRAAEQFLTLTQPPGERGLDHELVCDWQVSAEGLTLSQFADGTTLAWRDAEGRAVYACDGLRAWDARGRILPARMDRVGPDRIRIAVTDRDATYPIVIDPTVSDVSDGRVQLVLDAIGWQADGDFFYRFAVNNLGTVALELPLGPGNAFATAPKEGLLAPPTSIPPGRTVLAESVILANQSQTWTLRYRSTDTGSEVQHQESISAQPLTRQISPVLENGGYVRIAADDPGARIADWGYFNRLPYVVTIPRPGARNKFTPATGVSHDGWPDTFLPGRQVAVFTSRWQASALVNLVWSLDGRTATAASSRTLQPPGNRAPTALAQSLSVAWDSTLVITLAGSDPDGDAITIGAASTPANGTLVQSGATATYTPRTGYTGADSFTFTVSDGQLSSTPATIGIQVTMADAEPDGMADDWEQAQFGGDADPLGDPDADGFINVSEFRLGLDPQVDDRRMSPLLSCAGFDEYGYRLAPEIYNLVKDPSRLNLSAVVGGPTIRLSVSGSRHITVAAAVATVLTMRSRPGWPVTLISDGRTIFQATGSNMVTLSTTSDGLASVSISRQSSGPSVIQASSPGTQGVITWTCIE